MTVIFIFGSGSRRHSWSKAGVNYILSQLYYQLQVELSEKT